jgi:hypothetical protein
MVASLMASVAASSQTVTHDLMTFRLPPAFKRSTEPALAAWEARSPSGGVCTVVAYGNRPGSGSPAQDFRDDWKEFVATPLKASANVDFKTGGEREGWAPTVGVGVGQIEDVRLEVLMVVHSGYGLKITFLAIQTDDSCIPLLDPPVTSLRVKKPAGSPGAPAPATPSRPAANQHPLVGVWVGVGGRRSLAPLAGGGLEFSTVRDVKRIAFLADGRFCNILPDVGLAGLNLAQEAARNPYYWGVWEMSGNRGTINLHGGGSPFPFTLQGGRIQYDDFEFVKVPRVDNLRVQGTYSAERDPGEWQSHTRAEPTITLTADGRFSDAGTMYWLKHVRGYTEDDSARHYGAGRYHFENYTLTLYYDDGRVVRCAFLNFDTQNPAAPGWLNIGFQLLHRK